ncbi:MAG: hypothetical protein HY073_02115 [Deltaproteobacteria bacterium]|nr:hypothetical protein [Deltaproteobacteria bacterium]
MKKARLLAVALVAGWLASSAVWAAEKHETKGPEIKVPEGELEKAVENEEGLKRGGNVGKLHLFGYGEMHYNNKIGSSDDQIDFHRMVLGIGYDFTENLTFHSEVDFEHAFKEPELEFAYLDFLTNPAINFRAGSVLVPMGVMNQHHEPPLFYSVERPEVYRVIIPTSWQEGGAGIFGKLPAGFDYELYAMSSLQAADPGKVATDPGAEDLGFSGSNGIRDGRKALGETLAKDFAAVGRLQYKGFPGLRVGTSAFLGNTGQGIPGVGGAFLTMVEGDTKYSFQGIDLEGVLAFTNLSDGAATSINNVRVAAVPLGGTAFTDFVARQTLGWYLEGAYHLFHHLLPETKKDLVLFTRYEKFNTQFKMPSAFSAGSDPANDRYTVTTGVSYLPIPQVAIKADYSFNKNKANTGTDQFNLGIGFYY